MHGVESQERRLGRQSELSAEERIRRSGRGASTRRVKVATPAPATYSGNVPGGQTAWMGLHRCDPVAQRIVELGMRRRGPGEHLHHEQPGVPPSDIRTGERFVVVWQSFGSGGTDSDLLTWN